MLFIGLTEASASASEDSRRVEKKVVKVMCAECSEKWVIWAMETHGKSTFSVG